MSIADAHDDWAFGFQDETWWSRQSQPHLHSWGQEALRLIEPTPRKDDSDPKAFACYGLDVRRQGQTEMWLRFVSGNPKSQPTLQFLQWVLTETAQRGIRVLVMCWDNASWHKSKMVRDWIKQHNRQVKQSESGTRLIVCALPKRSPWLNAIEPKWIHAKRKVIEPDKQLSATELAARVCAVFNQPALPWLNEPEYVT